MITEESKAALLKYVEAQEALEIAQQDLDVLETARRDKVSAKFLATARRNDAAVLAGMQPGASANAFVKGFRAGQSNTLNCTPFGYAVERDRDGDSCHWTLNDGQSLEDCRTYADTHVRLYGGHILKLYAAV